ncbi:MAG: glycine dehydrogenase (aminomethyl-transferring), partial [Crocinitomicaceae bacterium]|nr:glycine dehydrogenase (aminomethyl-transferring) [Crocinitomicaceae bacterium]MDP4955685.1 glycine dehydrogenase (aminomethyl-transferring) [Crocinitomicaceae bacterium]
MTPFERRHIGPGASEQQDMLAAVGVDALSTLIDRTIPAQIRLNRELRIDAALSEQAYLNHINALGAKNKINKSFIGLGYHETIVPSVILRNVLENPGWYTAYTPYQAEIAQGRLEALLNFQTMVIELTGMTIANASLLDEATAAAEALIMFYNSRSRADIQAGRNKFFVDQNALPQSIDVMKGRALNLGIEFIVGDAQTFAPDATYFGIFVQYPNAQGHIQDWTAAIASWKAEGIQVAVGADLLSLVLLKSPGSMGADVVTGSAQRFGVPMGYGGPHAAFFATKEDYKRNLPGRIIGVSKDADDNQALRMALQTREQHIKRDKATSNICTAQALLAVMASMYAVYHGPDGIKQIAQHVHDLATTTANSLKNAGLTIGSAHFFDTIHVAGVNCAEIRSKAQAAGLNFYYISDSELSISFGEPHLMSDVAAILGVFGAQMASGTSAIPASLERTEAVLSHPVFNSYHSESRMMRYL